MAAELQATNPAIRIEILGVNMPGDDPFNDLITEERRLPWLQDGFVNSAWTLWGVTWRDVRILDARNRLVAVYNLTTFDLGVASNRATLKGLFLQAARFVDTDGDRLLDDWEVLNFGNLAQTPDGDPDGDGQNNFVEYAFGTDPNDARSKTQWQPTLRNVGSAKSLALSFRRRAGAHVDYFLETATELSPSNWSGNGVMVIEPFRNFFDGTGTGGSTCVLTAPVAQQPRGFLRVRAVPRSTP